MMNVWGQPERRQTFMVVHFANQYSKVLHALYPDPAFPQREIDARWNVLISGLEDEKEAERIAEAVDECLQHGFVQVFPEPYTEKQFIDDTIAEVRKYSALMGKPIP